MATSKNKTTQSISISPPREYLPLIDKRRKALHMSRTGYFLRLALIDLGLSNDYLPAAAPGRETVKYKIPPRVDFSVNERPADLSKKKKA